MEQKCKVPQERTGHPASKGWSGVTSSVLQSVICNTTHQILWVTSDWLEVGTPPRDDTSLTLLKL